MRKQHTLLAVPVFADTPESLRAAVLSAIDAGANLIELRLDLCVGLDDADVRRAFKSVDGSIQSILTNRVLSEGGAGDESTETRLERLIELAPWFDLVDVEYSTWRAHPTFHRAMADALRRPRPEGASPRDTSRRLIFSSHDFRGRPTSLQKTILACVETPECDVVKLAWQARSVRDCFEAFDIMRSCPKPAIAIAMGDLGIASRILAPKFGAFSGFARLTPEFTSADGQLSAMSLRGDYRWDSIGKHTEVYGVVGHPVAHSLSPVVHNDVFAIVGRDAVYVPLDVAPGFEAFKALMIEIRDRPWLGIRGLSVTLPHKEFAYRYFVGEGAVLDPGARRIGAVNTIRFDADGRVTAANSDIDGAIAAIRAAYGDSVIGAGRGALILGAGGAARAMMAALLDLGFDVTVTNRTDERASKMAGEFGTSSVLWSDRMNASPQLIVNCTSVGMSPNDESSPWPKEAFDGVECVIDTVYRPVETLLLRDGIAAGCRVVDGLVMFATQASRQYEIWTGNGPDDGLYRRAVERAIKRGRLRGR